jgi:hypothetical protein
MILNVNNALLLSITTSLLDEEVRLKIVVSAQFWNEMAEAAV